MLAGRIPLKHKRNTTKEKPAHREMKHFAIRVDGCPTEELLCLWNKEVKHHDSLVSHPHVAAVQRGETTHETYNLS